MKNLDSCDVIVTGIGVASSIGVGRECFVSGLLQGNSRFGLMKREGRQFAESGFIGAEICNFTLPSDMQASIKRTFFTTQLAVATLYEAWHDAQLDNIDSKRIGLIVGGSNFQQRELILLQQRYAEKPNFLRPSYGANFLDSDIAAVCTEVFNIQGMAFTIGGASASGHFTIIQAAEALKSGEIDACIALAPMMDLSFWECQGLRSLGAMGSSRFSTEPQLACRPFDTETDGFIFGESCGALVLERVSEPTQKGVTRYGRIAGYSRNVVGNRDTAPSSEGEVRAINDCLSQAKMVASDIDYINPHGTGSPTGDAIELTALNASGLSHAHINTTKSITGHGLTSAGAVEVIATLLQMQKGQLHPSLNLNNPIDPTFNWTRDQPVVHKIRNAINLSYGFGGINSAICLSSE